MSWFFPSFSSPSCFEGPHSLFYAHSMHTLCTLSRAHTHPGTHTHIGRARGACLRAHTHSLSLCLSLSLSLSLSPSLQEAPNHDILDIPSLPQLSPTLLPLPCSCSRTAAQFHLLQVPERANRIPLDRCCLRVCVLCVYVFCVCMCFVCVCVLCVYESYVVCTRIRVCVCVCVIVCIISFAHTYTRILFTMGA